MGEREEDSEGTRKKMSGRRERWREAGRKTRRITKMRGARGQKVVRVDENEEEDEDEADEDKEEDEEDGGGGWRRRSVRLAGAEGCDSTLVSDVLQCPAGKDENEERRRRRGRGKGEKRMEKRKGSKREEEAREEIRKRTHFDIRQ